MKFAEEEEKKRERANGVGRAISTRSSQLRTSRPLVITTQFDENFVRKISRPFDP